MSVLAFEIRSLLTGDYDRNMRVGDVVEFVDFCYRADPRKGLCCNRAVTSLVRDRSVEGWLSPDTLRPLSRDAGELLRLLRSLRSGNHP